MNIIIIIDDRQLLSKTLDRIVREEVTREDILEEATLEVTSTVSKRTAGAANKPSSVKKLKIESARKRAMEVLSQLKGKNKSYIKSFNYHCSESKKSDQTSSDEVCAINIV